jgi:hypothetical protein
MPTPMNKDFLAQAVPFTRKHWWKIAAAVICVGGIGWWAIHDSKPPRITDQSQVYKQIIGDSRSKKPQRLTFYWSASSQKSVDINRQYIRPLIAKEDPNVEVLLVQIVDDGADAFGPGGLMLCPKRIEDYARLVSGYLYNGKDVEKRTPLPEAKDKPLFLTNATIEEAKRLGLLDPASCLKDEYFWTRFFLAARENKLFFQRTPLKQLPQIEINGTFMLPDDPRVAQFVRRARSAPTPPR